MIAIAWLVGCAAVHTIDARPAARVTLPSGDVVGTPAEVTGPLRKPILARAPGHRELTVKLRGRRVELLLVPDHGPVGTWTADEVP